MATTRGISLLALAALICAAHPVFAARPRGDERNAFKSCYTPDYLSLKRSVLAQFKNIGAGKFGEFVKYGRKAGDKGRKVMALTFDACGGRHSGYNEKLIEYD